MLLVDSKDRKVSLECNMRYDKWRQTIVRVLQRLDITIFYLKLILVVL